MLTFMRPSFFHHPSSVAGISTQSWSNASFSEVATVPAKSYSYGDEPPFLAGFAKQVPDDVEEDYLYLYDAVEEIPNHVDDVVGDC